jgi:carbamoylphosphate synthase large subunit
MSFHYFIDRKDVGFYMAHQLGIKVPETYLLPCCKTPHFKEQDFIYHKHFDWDKIIKDIGFPSILKPANGRGAINVNQCNNKMELMFYYQKSGTELMTLQKKVDSPYDWQVRCICLGKHILPCQYVFRKNDQAEYIDKEDFLPKETLRKVIDSTQIINRAFGYEMNSVEFIIDRDGEPWAIDFNNPVPDGRLSALGEFWYKKYQDAMVNMIIDAAKESQNQPFLPEINQYADIARSNKTPTQKHRAALKIAKKYYNS